MTPQQLKERSRKTITAPNSGLELVIRRLTYLELNNAQIRGVLPAANSPDGSEQEVSKFKLGPIEAALLGTRMETQGTRYALEHGVVSPRVVFCEEEGKDVPDGAVDARWIADDLKFVAQEIMALSGFAEETKREVRDLTKNGNSSASLTSLPAGTDDSQRTS